MEQMLLSQICISLIPAVQSTALLLSGLGSFKADSLCFAFSRPPGCFNGNAKLPRHRTMYKKCLFETLLMHHTLNPVTLCTWMYHMYIYIRCQLSKGWYLNMICFHTDCQYTCPYTGRCIFSQKLNISIHRLYSLVSKTVGCSHSGAK